MPLEDLQNVTSTTEHERPAELVVGETTVVADLKFRDEMNTTKVPRIEINAENTTGAILSTTEANDLSQAKDPLTISKGMILTKDMGKQNTDFDNDYTFLSDRMPDLPEDEYLDLGEDATPLHFLKQSDTKTKQTPQQLTRTVTPIYITIPIYINADKNIPLALTIGGRDVPLTSNDAIKPTTAVSTTTTRPPLTKAPTSHFNRLLNPMRRTTNRHRSSHRSKIYARKDRMSPVVYKALSRRGQRKFKYTDPMF